MPWRQHRWDSNQDDISWPLWLCGERVFVGLGWVGLGLEDQERK